MSENTDDANKNADPKAGADDFVAAGLDGDGEIDQT